MTESLSFLVRDRWSSLLMQGFAIVDEDPGRVVLASTAVQIDTSHDPRGEVNVRVTLLGGKWPQQWSYSGMVGSASAGRLLEIALAAMQADPLILGGDAGFYERLGAENQTSSHAWTEYYAGRGPQPRQRHLP